MDDNAPRAKGWSDSEKVHLYLQMALKLNKIPWDDLDLPEGRTKKACTLMFDKDRTQFKLSAAGSKASGDNDGAEAAPAKKTAPAKKAAPKKRKADMDSEDEQVTAKKGKKSKAKSSSPALKDEDQEDDD